MSLGNIFENDLQKLIFNATPIANLADNAAAAPLANLYVALHTADPGEAGDQTSSEAAYTSYARVAVARTAGGWTVTNNAVSPAAQIEFPAATGGNESEMFFSVGVAAAGASKILYRGPIGAPLGPFVGAVDDNITLPGLAGLAVNDRIAFFAPTGAVLPTGLAEGTVYFVKTVAGDVITVSATQGGAAVNLTAVGDGVAYRVSPIVVANGVTPILGVGTTLIID